MPDRRAFLKLAMAVAAGPLVAWGDTLRSGRPAQRRFSSPAVEACIASMRSRLRDPVLAWMFENCYPNTLDTAVTLDTIDGQPDTFVITGDIDAMWLRDSTSQVWPYLPLLRADAELARLVAGVVRRQTRCVLIDPYANAFKRVPTVTSPHADDHTDMKPGVFERKYELDSLCQVLRLAYGYWSYSHDTSCFDDRWRDMARLVVRTMREQQRRDGDGPYRFQRQTDSPTETLWQGYGYPTRPTGLIHTGFRPSDDAGIYSYLIPANYLAVQALSGLADIYHDALSDEAAAVEAQALAHEVTVALSTWAQASHPTRGPVIPYEIDGLGNAVYMDDANLPSLLSLPYFGCMPASDTVYRNTRSLVLSPGNPYFFQGRAAEGVGSPHTGLHRIWPMSICMRALTSSDEGEISQCLTWLKTSQAGTGFMHESFDADDVTQFSRPWFAWANGLFGELVMTLAGSHSSLL